MLYQTYRKVTTGKLHLNPAPHWRMLCEYGGSLSIESYGSKNILSLIEKPENMLNY
jgi:hypothetical protein